MLSTYVLVFALGFGYPNFKPIMIYDRYEVDEESCLIDQEIIKEQWMESFVDSGLTDIGKYEIITACLKLEELSNFNLTNGDKQL